MRLIFVVMAANAVGWLASVTRNLVLSATDSADVPNTSALATLAYATVLGFGIAAVALAFGLAFGLGGREEAARVLREWRGNAAAVEHAVEAPAPPTHDGHPSRSSKSACGAMSSCARAEAGAVVRCASTTDRRVPVSRCALLVASV